MESMTKSKFSVLMSVYYKEKPENLNASLESILINQSLIPNQVVLIKDGVLTQELDSVIDFYKSKFDKIIDIVSLKENRGLGDALNIGVKHCKFDYIARMDSDDICYFDRFEKQINYFKNNSEVDFLGGNISEFYIDTNNVEHIRKVPYTRDEIKKRLKSRNPMNHVTIMMKKDSLISCGGYKRLLYLEGYFLWVRALENKCGLVNIDEEFVYVRTGDNMYARRGNQQYIKGWDFLQSYMKNTEKLTN